MSISNVVLPGQDFRVAVTDETAFDKRGFNRVIGFSLNNGELEPIIWYQGRAQVATRLPEFLFLCHAKQLQHMIETGKFLA